MGLYTVAKFFWNFVDKSDRKRIDSQTPTPNITKILDIPYAEDSMRAHLLDIYYPEGITEKLPVIIDVHGGGWMYGYKEINMNYNLYLASLGFTVFSINYRLFPEITLDGQIIDVMNALKWIGDNLESYPCDRKNVFLTGDSAGGQLAAYAAIANTSSELREIYSVPESGLSFNALALTSPACEMITGSVIDMYTKLALGKDYESKPHGKYINLSSIIDMGKMPPCFLVTSSGDFVARKQTLNTAELLTKKGIKCELHDFGRHEGKQLPHVFSVIEPLSEPGRQSIEYMISFLKTYMV